MGKMPTVTELLALSKLELVSKLGNVYEHSTWVAEELAEQAPCFSTVSELAAAMKSIVDNAPKEKKMELILSHPDLCQKVEKLSTLTDESQDEQSSAGLQSLTDEEMEIFTKTNNAYIAKFAFPFILAVRNVTKQRVLAALLGRVKNTPEDEVVGAMAEIHKIAWMRLLQIVNLDNAQGFLTCHVLDTANGCPAQNMRIQLRRLSPPELAGMVGDFVTNDDGRLEGGPALKGGKEFLVGYYEWTFYVGDYFASKKNTEMSSQPFLDVVPLQFGIDNPDDHYHVPLLVSPWSYSTYRGS
mmetsp:Transcript_1501/g.2089  ORF Transcript_1501/g.2089 Transcript_1501/m.2089 type:complete len:298 (-) Transcript_1501:32-925(-)